jgi:branched-chain amino acid transport system substrate-binding protein
MCAADSHFAPALADVMWAAGVKSIVIFQRGDSWGDGIINQLIPIWTAKGGEVAGDKVRYAAEATEFANYLTVADQEVATAVAKYGGNTNRVGVVILSFNEISVMLKQVSSYPNMYNVHWWGSDGTALSQRAMDDAPDEANHIGFYSLLSRETITPLYSQLESRYVALTKQQFSTYSAYLYDAAFAIAKSVIETGSTDASKVSAAFPVICNNMYGASGWCRLDSYGDRVGSPYDVWGFYPSATKASGSVIMAQYDPDLHKTTFFPSVLGYTPIGP